MPNQKELFNEPQVTFTDVELWLRTVPRLIEANRKNHIHDYIRNYDVINKIRRAKTLEFFNQTTGIDKENLSQPTLLDIIALYFSPVYKTGSAHIAYRELKRRKLRLISNTPKTSQKPRKPLKIAT